MAFSRKVQGTFSCS